MGFFSTPRRWCGVLVLTAATLAVSPAAAQQKDPFEPQLNQPGKDVQWVPTPPALVERMLDLAKLTPDDRLVDLGSGDGVLVIAAEKRVARARGIEYDGRLVDIARKKAREAGVESRTRFERGDLFKTYFSEASVVTSFLLPSMNLRLRPTFLAMKPGTRIVANTFALADWEPDETAEIQPCERWCKAMLWIVPARIGGTWRTPKGPLVLTQKFQSFTGTLGDEAVENGRIHGDEIAFTVGATSYKGRVEDDYRIRLSGTGGSKPVEWTLQPAPRR